MPEYTIANGEKQKIINREDALRVREEDSDLKGYIIHTDATVRLVTHEERDEARYGFPYQAQTTFTIDPHGYAIYAYADGAEATINVVGQKFTTGDMA